MMAHDVFVSYPHQDLEVAEAVVEALQARGIRCWIATRNIRAGEIWEEAIIEALDGCSIAVFVFSKRADASRQVLHEVERADAKGLTLLLFRIEEVVPSQAMEYHFGTAHWINAWEPPLTPHLEHLATDVAAWLAEGKLPPETESRPPIDVRRAQGARPEALLDLANLPARPPVLCRLAGRARLIEDLSEKLKMNQPVVLIGSAGQGKTALAAQVARRCAPEERIFWYGFSAGKSIDAMLNPMGEFLRCHGLPEFWHALHPKGPSEQAPPIALVDQMIAQLRGRDFLVCLDDFDLLADEPMLADFTGRLLGEARAGKIKLMILARKALPWLPGSLCTTLTGLDREETRAFLHGNGLTLPEEELAALQDYTGGNPLFLTLATEALRRGASGAELASALQGRREIGNILTRDVDQQLTDQERQVMRAVSIMMGYGATAEAIDAELEMPPGQSTRNTLLDLTGRCLLSAIDSPDGTLYRQHAIVSDFYTKSLIPRPLLRAMHRRAGEYYASEEPDIFRATAHLQRAGEHQRAARLVAADVWGLINAGKARGLCRLLADFKADQMETLDWVRVQIGLGIALALVGESEQAQFSYTSALAWLDELPAGDVEADVLKARACYGLGDLLRHEDPKAALAWLGRGLEMFTASQAADLRPAQRQERAALLIKMATVLVTQGDFARALAAVTEGMSLLPLGPRPLRVSALINLGSIAYFCGDREQGRETTRQGRDMSRQLHDTYRTAELLGDVAIDKEIAGDWEGAAADYASALSLAEQLGSIAQLARLSLDLGILKTKQGDNAAALELLENGLRMAQEHNLHHHEAAIRPSLADLHLRRGEAVLAAGLLPEAERLALKHKINTQLPDIYRVWAEVRLAQGAPGEALRYARSSLSSAREQGMKEEEGVSLRVLGATLLAQGEREAALEAFRESLALLVGAPVPRPIDVPEALDLQECADPYEAARTAARYGHALRSSDPIPGRALIEAARAEFARLGATRDLGEAQELLS